MFTTELEENCDFTKTCRLCLNQNNDNKLISIFDISSFEVQYSIIINECTSLKITEDDNLPKNICLKCMEDLNKFYKFRILVVNSELRLNDFLNKFLNNDLKVESINIKKEIDSNEETTCPFKSENDSYSLQENSKIENEFKVAEGKIKIEEKELPIASFPVKSKENEVLEIESKIEIVDEKLVIDENETDLHKNKKIDHETSYTHRTIHKKSNKKSENPFRCRQCKKSFCLLVNLNRHKRIHTDEKSFRCNQCGICFSQLGNLIKHIRIHTGEKPFRCNQCGMCFNQMGNLNLHKRIHTGEKPYICKLCDTAFSRLSTLKTHETIHTGERLYNCDQCGKTFSTSSKLITHKRIHTGERPYICELCGTSFKESSNLKSHKKIHTGEKPYNCIQCGKSFARLFNLKVHEKSHESKT